MTLLPTTASVVPETCSETLVDEATRLTGIGTRRALVHEALRALVETKRRRTLAELRGKVKLASGYDYKAARAGTR